MEQLWTRFKKKIHSLMESYIPAKTINNYKVNMACISKQVKSLTRQFKKVFANRGRQVNLKMLECTKRPSQDFRKLNDSQTGSSFTTSSRLGTQTNINNQNKKVLGIHQFSSERFQKNSTLRGKWKHSIPVISGVPQDDLDKLAAWEKNWGMAFHPDKFNVIRFSRSSKTVPMNFTLKGHDVQNEDYTRYLGVELQSNISWNRQIDQTVKKAKSMLGFQR